MRTILLLLACALLGAGCDSDDTVATPTPIPTATPIPKTDAELKQEAKDREEMKPRKDAAVKEQDAGAATFATPAP
jgi:hypothetical protein